MTLLMYYVGGGPKWLLRELFHGKQGGQGQRPSVVGVGLICWHVSYCMVWLLTTLSHNMQNTKEERKVFDTFLP